MGLVVEYFVTDRAMSEWHGYAKVFSGKEKKKRKTKTVGVSMNLEIMSKNWTSLFLATRGLIAALRV